MHDIWTISMFEVTLRLLIALFLGGLIGFEREVTKHAAGFRTHILVCLGSALIMLLSIYGFSEFVNETNVRVDPARLATAVISGIGFLGAGTIIRTGRAVSGLTTAASLWVVAAIGLSIGAGFYYPAIISTVLMLVSLVILNKVETSWFQKTKIYVINITAQDDPEIARHVLSYLKSEHLVIHKMSIERENAAGSQHKILNISLSVHLPRRVRLAELVETLYGRTGVQSVSME